MSFWDKTGRTAEGRKKEKSRPVLSHQSDFVSGGDGEEKLPQNMERAGGETPGYSDQSSVRICLFLFFLLVITGHKAPRVVIVLDR